MNNLLSSEEVKQLLELPEGELEGLVQKGKLHAYKVGGTYLRFRKEEILILRQELLSRKATPRISWLSRLRDFWRFNNFYILSLLVIGILFFLAVRT